VSERAHELIGRACPLRLSTPQVLTTEREGPSVPKPAVTRAEQRELQKLTEAELRQRVRELEKARGEKFKGLKKYSKEKLVQLLSGEWQGWIRKDLGLPPLPVTHRGRLTKWCAFLCSKVRARQPHRLVLGARCREVCPAPAATHARTHARTQSSSVHSPRVSGAQNGE
jgi:hypothetical protein